MRSPMSCRSAASGASSSARAPLACSRRGCRSVASPSRRSSVGEDGPMTRSPLVGLTLRAPDELNLNIPLLARNRAYFAALEATPVGISASLSELRLRELFDVCDGICLPGGPDVGPKLYGEEPRADCSVDVDPELDRAEMLLVRWALDADKPLLAICRGPQLLNVALGGTLWEDVATMGGTDHNHYPSSPRGELTHDIEVEIGRAS